MRPPADRFDGWIGGVGTASGTRIVVGHWPWTPFGAFTDVMVEHPDGHRLLLAPSTQVADFVAATYTFDEVRIVPVELDRDGDRVDLVAGDLAATLRLGRRPALGLLLRSVPAPLATARWWIRTIDTVARCVLPGVRTVGSAGGGRTEYYGARDLHRIVDARVRFAEVDQGALAPVRPAVRFGFGSTPSAPSWVRITTLVATSRRAARRPGDGDVRSGPRRHPRTEDGMQQQMDEKLYDQLVAYLAAKGTVREDARAGVLIISALHGQSYDPPFRLHLTPPTLHEHLEAAAPGSASAHPDVAPLEASWRVFTVQIGESVEAAKPGETELVLAPTGLVAQRAG